MNKTAGVYAIYLTGTPYVYVGESKDIESRWIGHRDAWVWPNAARHEVLYECADAAMRRVLERTEHDAHRADGYILLSTPGKGNAGQRNRSVWAAMDPAKKAAHGARKSAERKAYLATLTQEQRAAIARKAEATKKARLTPEQRSEIGRRGNSAARTQDPSADSRGGIKGSHQRWHVGRGIVNNDCGLCRQHGG